MSPQSAAPPLYQRKAEFFRLLGHPVRIRALEMLSIGPTSVRALLDDTGVEPAYLSQQMAVLRRAGVVTSHREGPAVVYALTGPDVADLLHVARRILAELLEEQQRLVDELREDVPSVPPVPGEPDGPGQSREGTDPMPAGRYAAAARGSGG